MAVYLVSYDLDKPGQDYTDLINAIKQMGGVKCLYSEWFVATDITASDIYNQLSPFIDGNDRMAVLRLEGSGTWYNLMISNDKVRQLLAA